MASALEEFEERANVAELDFDGEEPDGGDTTEPHEDTDEPDEALLRKTSI
jgi:hypothetical protein